MAAAAKPVRDFAHNLIRWYDNAKRDLPWRRTRDPYRIWVSEIMLQQTRVAAAIPYYEAFLHRFPSVEALAAADEQLVLAAWSGLGYYSRARNLQRAARQIVEQGRFPQTWEAIRALPGIGDYTAAAVASIAFDVPKVVVDGNVLRVMSRYLGDSGDIALPAVKKRLGHQAQLLLDPGRPGDFNQALMELGATLCLPREPHCLLCPIAQGCVALRDSRQQELPVKKQKQSPVNKFESVVVVEHNGGIFLQQRPADAPRMPGFWELPPAGDSEAVTLSEQLGVVRHGITVNRYHVTVWRGHASRSLPGSAWFPREQLTQIPITTITRKALKLANFLTPKIPTTL